VLAVDCVFFISDSLLFGCSSFGSFIQWKKKKTNKQT
jgi:hypothetical protein